jgi:dihydroorotase
MRKIFLAILTLFFGLSALRAQTTSVTSTIEPAAPLYKLLIKGGRVLDPKNNIDDLMDVAVQDGKIARVAKNIDPALAEEVVDAIGLYVTPGLIDLHTHVFAGTEPDHYLSNGLVAVFPDAANLKAGVTTVVDAGGAGYKSFNTFKKNIIDHSITRVLSFINIVGEGMRGGEYEQNPADMDPKKADSVARANKQYVVGFKLAHYRAEDWTGVERVVEAGKLANLPVMIDFGGDANHPPLSLEELLTKHLRPGDIFTHVFTELPFRESVVDPATRELKPFVAEAQRRGIIFDVGFGGGSLDLRQAQPAIKAGFYPNTLGTDLHAESILGAMKDELNVMSLFMALGMDLNAVVKAASWAPAQAIHREELGNLSVGSPADIAVLNLRHGYFGFKDIYGNKVNGTDRLECEVTVRAGRVVYDFNGIASTPGKPARK